MPTRPESESRTLLEVRDLDVRFALRGGTLKRLLGVDTGTVKAVDGVDLSLHQGEVVGVVGESGSGKSTLGRALLGLVPATSGSISYRPAEGTEQVVSEMSDTQLRRLRTDLQMVFQDPHAALNPSMTLLSAVGHPLRIHSLASGEQLRDRVVEALERVGLSPAEQFLDAYPGDLSGGQKQRAVIARAIITEPQVLVADEPVSMLDMSVRAKILQLMLDLKHDLGLTYLYITHDLATAKFFCDRIAIMYLGRIVEIGPTAAIFADPKHPYTKALLKAIPEPDPRRSVPRDLPRGEIPDAARPPLGCAFHPRCPEAVAECGWEARDLRASIEEHWTRRGPDAYAEQRGLLDDLSALQEPAKRVVLGDARTAPQAAQVLEDIRAERPDDPLWSGVQSIDRTRDGVEVVFRPGYDPLLRPSGRDDEVEVACVLYPEPVTGDPSRDEVGG